MKKLESQIMVITNAAGGLSRATVLALAQRSNCTAAAITETRFMVPTHKQLWALLLERADDWNRFLRRQLRNCANV